MSATISVLFIAMLLGTWMHRYAFNYNEWANKEILTSKPYECCKQVHCIFVWKAQGNVYM